MYTTDMITSEYFTRSTQTLFFIEQAIKKAPDAFRLHITWGVWDPVAGLGPHSESESTVGEWNNVTEHCLIAMTRGEILADMLDLPSNLKIKLINALALHDISKPQEVIHAKKFGISWDSYEKITTEADAKLREAGFDEETIHLSGAMGHPSLQEAESLLRKTKYTSYDLAYLIAHYCDDISVKADWCEPVAIINGKKINQLDRRMERNIDNLNIAKLGEEGRTHLNGRNTFDAQREIGHAVEKILAMELEKKGVILEESLELPEFIDKKIMARIKVLHESLM